MNCEKCGFPLEEGAPICPNCGEAQPLAEPAFPNAEDAERVTENIYLCKDGKYRWIYEMPMLKNPTILFTVWKVLGISLAIVFGFLFILALVDSVDRAAALLSTGKMLLIFIGVFFVISLIAYFIVAASFGFKYCVLFEMDEEQLTHAPLPKNVKKADALNMLTVLVGIAAGRPSVVGAGALASAKTSSTSEFERVKRVRLRPRRNTIFLDQLLNRNQVYAAAEDYEFAAGYILERCTNAKTPRAFKTHDEQITS